MRLSNFKATKNSKEEYTLFISIDRIKKEDIKEFMEEVKNYIFHKLKD